MSQVKISPAAADKMNDRYTPAPFRAQTVDGILGDRMRVNLQERLLTVNTGPLLAGYVHRPGQQTWIGEHAAKFIDAATNTWAYTHDPKLKAKLDETVKTLLAAQEPDGYLGTYTPEHRWTEWDVWAHKYNLIALLNYYRTTGDPAALNACRRMGDLLVKTFGEGPGQRNIAIGTPHRGMASTSVLEGVDMLYRYTGDGRYLEFCRYIVRSWETPGGPHIISSLLKTRSVQQVADAKGYEMLSNFVGLLDLYRLTGEKQFFEPVEIAWNDIIKNRLYITGTTTWDELFRPDHDLRPYDQDIDAGVGEGCVTVTWMQINWHLLRLTGEAKYADELERTIYNALLAAQSPRKGTVCYFTGLNGRKMYGAVSQGVPGVSCCTSSIPRGISLIPETVWGLREDGIAINLYTPGRFTATLRQGAKARSIAVNSTADFPLTGDITLEVRSPESGAFPVYLRVPDWCSRFQVSVNGKTLMGQAGTYLEVKGTWTANMPIHISMDLTERIISGDGSAPHHVAFVRGPQVLALDAAVNSFTDLSRAVVNTGKKDKLKLESDTPALPTDWKGHQAYAMAGTYANHAEVRKKGMLLFVPFADAGQEGSEYRVWIDTLAGE